MSIKIDGRAVGYGTGVTESMEVFTERRRSQELTETGATLTNSSGSSVNFSFPKGRPNRNEKAAAAVSMVERKEQKIRQREQKEAAKADLTESQWRFDVDVCPRCGIRFLTKGGFSRHYEAGCRKYETNQIREERRVERSVLQRLAVTDALAIETNLYRKRDLAYVKVNFKAPSNKAVLIGIELDEERDGEQGNGCTFIVSAVSGLALDTARVKKGYFLVRVGDGSMPLTKRVLSRHLCADESLEVTFLRPPPPIPLHGSARQMIHKQPRFVMNKAQEEWLKTYAYDHSTGRDLLRPIVAFESMKAYFRDQLRKDTKTPMWLERDVISKWITEQKKVEKQKRRQNSRAGSAETKKKKTRNSPGNAISKQGAKGGSKRKRGGK